MRAVMIYADKKALRLYDFVKQRLLVYGMILACTSWFLTLYNISRRR